jgi:ABC-type uncharacterized transport system permease subunit
VKIRAVIQPALAATVGLALGLAFTWAAGENPWHVLQILGRGAAGSAYDLGMTLFYSTPLIFTGLSVAVAFQAGLFNVGAEGQLTVGALAAAAAGVLLPRVPSPLAPLFAIAAALLAGAIWGAIPGWLRVRRGSHEVINTIMMNFIAVGIASYVTLNLLKNPESQNPETKPLGAAYLLPQFGMFGGAPVSLALPLAILAAACIYVWLSKTVFGFQIRATGQNEIAAGIAGLSTDWIRVVAFAVSGALAGLMASSEVLGSAGRFRLGFSAEYGFTGIAVALLARNHPLGVVPAALLFGALHKGAANLDIETDHVTRETALIFQGLIILAVSAEGLWNWTKRNSGTGPSEGTSSASGSELAQRSGLV